MTSEEVTVRCAGCKTVVTVADTQALVKASRDDISVACSNCQKPCAVAAREISCPSCRSSFWVADQLLGRHLACPHCASSFDLPGQEEWKELRQRAERFQWTIVPASAATTVECDGTDTLTRAIVAGQIKGADRCFLHPFAPGKPLREACDPHFHLRKLYDPVGAWAARSGTIGGSALLATYALAHMIGGFATMGGRYFLVALFGILAVVLTPTVIGLGIVYVIASAVGIPLLGAYIGVVLAVLIGVPIFLLGRAIGSGAARSLGRMRDLQAGRQASWD